MTTSILTKSGQVNKLFINALLGSRFDETQNKIYPVSYSGTGNYISKKDHTFYVTQLLENKGYKYTQGNDAPRGGQNGNYIKVSKVAFNYLKSLIN
jgi:hypothetical protein